MKVLDVFIVEGNSPEVVIKKAMSESSKRRTMTEILDSLIVTGNIGRCECVIECVIDGKNEKDTTTHYFFATPIDAGFYRVEYCVSSVCEHK